MYWIFFSLIFFRLLFNFGFPSPFFFPGLASLKGQKVKKLFREFWSLLPLSAVPAASRRAS